MQVSEKETQASGTGQLSEELPDFDNIHINFEVEEPVQEGATQNNENQIANSHGQLSREQFYQAFKAIFDYSSMFSKIDSLKISPEEVEAAQAASNVFYDMALEIPYLSFLIEPSNIWAQRAVVVGSFGYAKYHVVKLELEGKAEAKKEEVKENQEGVNYEQE